MPVLYTTHCPQCRVLEAKLKQKNIEYIENTDIEEMKSLGMMSAPMLKVNDSLLSFVDAVKWVNSQ